MTTQPPFVPTRIGLAAVVVLTCLAGAVLDALPTPALTAAAAIARIRQHVGVPWQEQTVDTFKAGDPDTRVTGIAVTMMATLDVLQRAAAAGQNLIITHEPTYYGHLDETGALARERDPVFEAKQAFIRTHGLVVWRFHDHWHMRRPDGIQDGMIHALGWESYASERAARVFTLPSTSVTALAAHIRQRLGARTLRVVGDPDMTVTKVALAPGAAGFARHRPLLQREDVEVLVIGEVPEWETIEYVADAVTARQRKALILVGHVRSEQAGMDACATWLRTFITEVPVTFVPASDMVWAP
jgi:putative NIF3 family GTP cyclohydrolase 1 type 2